MDIRDRRILTAAVCFQMDTLLVAAVLRMDKMIAVVTVFDMAGYTDTLVAA